MKQDLPHPDLVDEWLKRAYDDELNIRSILKHRDGTSAVVCFLSQQMAEKHFKALLLKLTGKHPKVHDLGQLAELTTPYFKKTVKELTEEMVLLNRYYIGTRYPGDIDITSFSWEMAEEAFDAAMIIKNFVLEKLYR
ncbi:MAG: HEPN domain-containing protein [Chlamydiae bacterium]|nr:HEPN domain-containing protein [Chlamydiota bacterium]MBI3276366.1 HEPN domain-containing protein [Chlamydiota bacterium]